MDSSTIVPAKTTSPRLVDRFRGYNCLVLGDWWKVVSQLVGVGASEGTILIGRFNAKREVQNRFRKADSTVRVFIAGIKSVNVRYNEAVC